MLPIPDGSWVTGEFVQNWNLIRDNMPYIILTLDDGIVFKVVHNDIKSRGKLKLISLNTLYDPYDIDIKDVREVWKFVHYIANVMPEQNTRNDELALTVASLKRDMDKLKKQLNPSQGRLLFEE